MRDYKCYIYRKSGNKLELNDNDACWAGVQDYKGGDIYIGEFTDKKTIRHVKELISILNEITPTSLVKENKKRYIKFKLLDNYQKNLVVLNFIRNLWYEPYGVIDYTKKFFEYLKESKDKYEDPLQRLTWANKKASVGFFSNSIHFDHCNITASNKLKIKTKEQLFAYDGYTQSGFLSDGEEEEDD